MFIEDYGVWVMRYLHIWERKQHHTEDTYLTEPIGAEVPFTHSYVFLSDGKKVLRVSPEKVGQDKNLLCAKFTSPHGIDGGNINAAKSANMPMIRYKGRDINFCRDFRLPLYYWALEAITAMEKDSDIAGKLPLMYSSPKLASLKRELLKDFASIPNKDEFEIELNVSPNNESSVLTT